MVYHIHLTNQTINNLVKIEGGIVLPDINLNSKEVQTSHLGVTNITSHKDRDKLWDLEVGTGFAFGAGIMLLQTKQTTLSRIAHTIIKVGKTGGHSKGLLRVQ